MILDRSGNLAAEDHPVIHYEPGSDYRIVKTAEEALAIITEEPGYFLYCTRQKVEHALIEKPIPGLNLHYYPADFVQTCQILLSKHSPFAMMLNRG